ncbi:MAG: chromosome partitioning protein [Flavobacteriales bacterium]|jgi:chromosome partitioning protein
MITVALYNLKGGVGKTTTAVNLAYLAAEAKKKTILWDWDPQGAASWYCGIDEPDSPAIQVFQQGEVVGSLQQSTPFPNLTVVPADLSLRNTDTELATNSSARQLVRKLIEPLSKQAEIVIFDCPPTINPSIEYLLSGVDLVLVPTIPSPMSIRAMRQVVDFFDGKTYRPKNIVAFFNMVDKRRTLHKQTLSSANFLPLPLMKTYVPMDSAAEKMSHYRKPLTSYARGGNAARAYRAMWKEIISLIRKSSMNKTDSVEP